MEVAFEGFGHSTVKRRYAIVLASYVPTVYNVLTVHIPGGVELCIICPQSKRVWLLDRFSAHVPLAPHLCIFDQIFC